MVATEHDSENDAVSRNVLGDSSILLDADVKTVSIIAPATISFA